MSLVISTLVHITFLFSIVESPADTPVKTATDSLALELEPLVAVKPSPEPERLDIPRPKREISQESDTDSDNSPPTTIRKPPKATTFAEGKKLGHHKQLSLYSWLSSPPTTSPPTSSQTKATVEGGLERKLEGQIKGKKIWSTLLTTRFFFSLLEYGSKLLISYTKWLVCSVDAI